MKQLLLLLLLSASLNAQTIKAIYSIEPLMAIKEGQNNEISDKYKNPILYSFTYSKNKSLQELIATQKTSIDTVYLNVFGKKLETIKTMTRASKEVYYKDFSNDVFQFIAAVGDNTINEKKLIPNYNWEITDEKKEIRGYQSTKAIGTTEIVGNTLELVAWYSDSIPIPDGPINYHGLPGLIIQLEIGEFSLLTLEKLKIFDESTDIQEPSN